MQPNSNSITRLAIEPVGAISQDVSALTRTSAGRGHPSGPATEHTPNVFLPLRFILTGVLALFVGAGWLIARPEVLATYHYNQYVIALTHLFVLGWLCTVVMGAMYQLVPVALETRLHSERMAAWQFVFHGAGCAGMVWMFWVWDLKQVGHFGSALALGVGLFVYNLARTLGRVPRWNVVATAVAASLFWLSLTVLAGLSIAAGKCTYESAETLSATSVLGALVHGLRAVAAFMARFDQFGAMHAHAHLGAVGFFLMLIVGISYKLIPMFTLSEAQSRARAAWSVALLNVGLAGSFLTVLLRHPWKPVFALLIVAALGVFGWELRAIVRARKRRSLDWGVKSFLTALGCLAPLSVLALVLSWPGLPLNAVTGQLENAYGFLGLIGVVSFAILGMLHKIIPFQVWFHVYGKEIGRRKVPALAEMYSARWQMAGYWFFVAGLLLTTFSTVTAQGTWVRAGCVLLAFSFFTFAVNLAKILSHLIRPRVEPLNSEARPSAPAPSTPEARNLSAARAGASSLAA